MGASYQFGIEEEYFLADAATRGTPGRRVTAFHAAVRARLPAVEREFLQSQVEVSTPPSTSFAEAGEVLGGLRAGLVGTPEQVTARIREYEAAGVDLMLLQFSPQREEMARFGRDVITPYARA